MNWVVFAALLSVLAGCSMAPSTGPLRSELVDQGGKGRFSIVAIDDRVVDTLSAQPHPPFHTRFKKYQPPPELSVAIGDVVAVTIWESTENGLFGRSLHASLPNADQFADKLRAAGIPVPRDHALTPTEQTAILTKLKETPQGQLILQSLQPTGRSGTRIPDQPVGPDGGISIPYGGRIKVAGLTPSAVQHKIEEALGGQAIDPQALILVKSSDTDSVTVAGELVHGARVQLSSGGTRLLDVIASAGGARAPVRDTFVELSRGGVTATIPLETLVAEPDENIYARPGDVLTLVRRPRVISVFGATGKQKAVTFNADRVYLSEALAQAGGLSDRLADPRAVFLLRYENDALIAAFHARPVREAGNGTAPVAYKLDLADMKSYGWARRFPLRDKDVVYVADAASTPLTKVLNVFSLVTQPVTNAYLLCQSGEVHC